MRYPLLLTIALAACAVEADTSTTAAAVTPPCSAASCEPTIGLHKMFNESDFTQIRDGWGRVRRFFVHIPARYDSLTTSELMPVIFAFHGGGQDRQAMIDGIWDAYFEQDYAFVIPLGEPDPCERMTRQWLSPGLADRAATVVAPCRSATEVFDPTYGRLTYWRASDPDSFTDVRFIEALRATVLARFAKLNPNKVYATGFSAGGGMALTLACYRSSLFRAFSAVGKELGTASVRGDFNGDTVADVDPDSWLATCGRTQYGSGYATGITAPDLWGTGPTAIPTPSGPFVTIGTAVRPVAMFFGDNDIATRVPPLIVAEPDYTTDFVRARNNLGTAHAFQNSYNNTGADNATTQRRTYTAPSGLFPAAALRRFEVSAPGFTQEARHAIPDVDRCTTTGGPIMTCDYNYTDETIAFWQLQAALDLVP